MRSELSSTNSVKPNNYNSFWEKGKWQIALPQVLVTGPSLGESKANRPITSGDRPVIGVSEQATLPRSGPTPAGKNRQGAQAKQGHRGRLFTPFTGLLGKRVGEGGDGALLIVGADAKP